MHISKTTQKGVGERGTNLSVLKIMKALQKWVLSGMVWETPGVNDPTASMAYPKINALLIVFAEI